MLSPVGHGSSQPKPEMENAQTVTRGAASVDRMGLHEGSHAPPAEILSSDSLAVVFAFEPTGLGHLRVTRALYLGLPRGVHSHLLGSDARMLSVLHRISSVRPWARSLFEWIQRGKPEDVATAIFRSSARAFPGTTLRQISTIVEQRVDRPSTMLAVATHFGLAHQLAAIKERLLREHKVKLILVVQVTDDSPQHIWYVRGADLTVVPSRRTRLGLLAYARRQGDPNIPVEVCPYPISPSFSAPLSPEEQADRRAQLDPGADHPVQLSVPISGAAVGLDFAETLLQELRKRSGRYRFNIVSKHNEHTAEFLERRRTESDVALHTADNDRVVVRKYEELYNEAVIGLEVTKPSEQAFKALCRPDQRAGAILLLSRPVGRQEYDNLRFLRRHRLLPFRPEMRELHEAAAAGRPIPPELAGDVKRWRVLELPHDGAGAAQFIHWAGTQGVFAQMSAATVSPSPGDFTPDEISPDGVHRFWARVARLVAAART